MTTSALVNLLARRAWTNDPAAEPSNYRAVLAMNPPDSLDHAATWADIQELSAASNPGYARSPLTNWAKAQPYEVAAQCAGFKNTGGEPWQAANWFCVIADFPGGTVLCWTEPVVPPILLAAGDRITFPDGPRFRLMDSYA